MMDRHGIPARAFPPGAKYFAASAQAQNSRARMRGFAAKLGEHRVEHRASDFVAMLGIIQGKVQDIAGPLDHYTDWRMGAGRFNRFR